MESWLIIGFCSQCFHVETGLLNSLHTLSLPTAMSHTHQHKFTPALLVWHHTDNNRSLPWKSEKDPYKIWLSEIILQQTRALQGLPYYMRFTEAYPTIQQLAAAADEEVYRIWQGLGYYNRCRNMLATARHIVTELSGIFPSTYEGILSLKGIGPYTAAAIGSFAFGLPCAVVDGNVTRVLSRYFGIETPIDTTEGKNIFATLAQELLPQDDSAAYNQAIMDLGATVCTPKAPTCSECPLQKNCEARISNLTSLLPIKSKKVLVTTRHFNYLVLRNDDFLWLQKRGEQDIWGNLFEPYLIESDAALTRAELTKLPEFKGLQLPYTDMEYSGKSSQRLTHRIIEASFFTLQLSAKADLGKASGSWVALSELNKMAFPKTVLSFLQNNLYF